ncbi:MAG: DUF3110 domain-containing protein [Pseudanabaenaceae cyanobacterium bins.68]|nr:DUF3110 domain-containing protein [Pseudanabaenaceae cyanobacterium bins.68]
MWILLYNSGTDNEGIYARYEGGKNTVIAFDQEDDALRYSVMLEAQDFPEPKIERISETELRQFCLESNLSLLVISPTDLVLPPEQNLEQTDWQPNRARVEEPESEFSAEQLDRLRLRLEGLLE